MRQPTRAAPAQHTQVDIAVHSMKDLPTLLPEGLEVCCVFERGTTEDALVLHAKHKGRTLETLPAGSVVGTSALRRIALLKKHCPHLQTKDIRGNVNTRCPPPRARVIVARHARTPCSLPLSAR